MWDLWWAKGHRDSFFTQYFGFAISIIPLVLHAHSFIYHQLYYYLSN